MCFCLASLHLQGVATHKCRHINPARMCSCPALDTCNETRAGQAEAAKRALHCACERGEPLPPREPSGAHLIAARRSLATVAPCT